MKIGDIHFIDRKGPLGKGPLGDLLSKNKT